MTRYLLCLPFLAGPAAASVVPPIPRAVILPGVADPPAEQPPADPNDPAATAERIVKNAKELGDRLGKDDTGPDTQAGQDRLKKDIESLIQSMENPPPMGGGGGGPPPPPMGDSPPPMGGQPPPTGGGQPQPQKSGRKPRGGQPPPPMGGGQPMPMGGQPMPMPGGGDKKPAGAEPKGGDDKKPAPAKPNPDGGKTGQGGMGGRATPALPMEDAIARDFWGNLPDVPRERMMQFFREQYMSRYKDLLPQYYQSLAEKEKKAKK